MKSYYFILVNIIFYCKLPYNIHIFKQKRILNNATGFYKYSILNPFDTPGDL